MMIKKWFCKTIALMLFLGMMLAVAGCSSDSDDFDFVAGDEHLELQMTGSGSGVPSAVAADDAPAESTEAIEFYMAFETYDDVADIGFFAYVPREAEASDWNDISYEEPSPAEDYTSAYTAELPLEEYQSPTQEAPAPAHLGVDAMQRMIIRAANMRLNTLYYQDIVSGIETIVANRGGFIENSRQWMVYCRDAGMLWRAEYVIRVPVGLFDTTNNELMALGQVQYFSTTSRDATHEFNDLGSRLQIREAEEVRVQRMLEEATELADIIDLEARLTNLRLIIDAYRRRREEIDQLASFSTINLAVSEVVELPEIEEDEEEAEEEEEYYVLADGFGDRISGAFSASVNFMARALEGLGVFLALIIVPVGFLVVFVGIIYFIVIKISGRPLRWRRSKP